MCKGISQILKRQYMNNFIDDETLAKVYTTESIVSNLMRMLVGIVGTVILNHFDIKISMIIGGIIFLVFTFILYVYMLTRLGLKPEEYDKADITFR